MLWFCAVTCCSMHFVTVAFACVRVGDGKYAMCYFIVICVCVCVQFHRRERWPHAMRTPFWDNSIIITNNRGARARNQRSAHAAAPDAKAYCARCLAARAIRTQPDRIVLCVCVCVDTTEEQTIQLFCEVLGSATNSLPSRQARTKKTIANLIMVIAIGDFVLNGAFFHNTSLVSYFADNCPACQARRR